MAMSIILGTLGVFAVIVVLAEIESRCDARKLTWRDRVILYPLTFALLLAAMWIGART